MADKSATLAEAVTQHVRAGDVIHPVVGHTRWTAATREVVRQWWGRDPGFTAPDNTTLSDALSYVVAR